MNVWDNERSRSKGKLLTLSLAVLCLVALIVSCRVNAQIEENPRLDQNYPNPFNSFTEIKYFVPEQGHVKIRAFNMLGNEVAIIEDAMPPKGEYKIRFDGSALPSGQYSYTMLYTRQSGGGETKLTKKMHLVR